MNDYLMGMISLESFIKTRTLGIEYGVEPKTTNNWEKFKVQTKTNGYITVSGYGCDRTIYSTREINILARLWHDTLHLELDVGFDLESEKIVAEKQCQEVYDWLIENDFPDNIAQSAYSIIYHDIVSQAEYYERYARFVPYQKEFVISKFLNEY